MQKQVIYSLTLFLAIFLSGAGLVSAAITNPYTVDEKSQVIFGDSAIISTASSTYFGLENYIVNYINGYAHFSYTYTHTKCCFDSYPPRVYITANNPTATTTPVVKSMGVIFQLLPIPIPPGHDTDWYSYDIQLDANGYTIVVKQRGEIEVANYHVNVAGLVDSDWVALANLHPLATPPFTTPNSMSFTPVPLRDTPLPPTRTPVIIVPGIMSTKLMDESTLPDDIVWPNFAQIALSITDDFLDVLKMGNDGLPDNSNIITGEVITKFSDADYIDALITTLIDSGYTYGEDLFIFPYDWRLDINSSANKLSEKINEIKSQTNAQKVDIISHSMGGLLIKEYLRQEDVNYIDKFIDVGTPHLGSSNAFKTLMYGDNIGISYILGLFNLNQERIKIISQNMPSVYQLLPSSLYGNYLYDLDDFDQNGIKGLLSYLDTKEFLKNTGRNSTLVDRADAFHQEIDSLNPANYGVKTYNIVGCGTETLGKIFIVNKEDSGGVEYNISYVNGDGTVPLKSAEALPADQTFYLKKATHALMPSTSGVKELIRDILNATSTEEFDISPYTNLATSANGCNIPNGRIVSFHSPIELHIYSGDKHVGPNTDGDIEINIPGVSYEVIDGNKFAYLPDGIEYVVKGNATEAGTFNVRIETIQNEIVVETKYFNAVPLATTTQIEVATSTILVDNNTDGVVDLEVQPSSVLDEIQSGDLIKPTTSLGTNPLCKRDCKFDKPVKITLTATDDNSGVLKTEYSLNNLSSWVTYTSPFTIGTKGETKVYYRSTDRAGNVEFPKSVTININPPGNSGKK